MHRATQLTRRVVPLHKAGTAGFFSSSSRLQAAQPNPRLDLDLEALLQDVDMALHSHPRTQGRTPQELQVIPPHSSEAESNPDPDREMLEELPRKSPAALFGSQRLGAVTLPLELQGAIQRLISETNKTQLHSDAKRLFQQDAASIDWEPHYGVRYRTRIQGVKHAKRDGTAFASVALPAHYSAIFAVLDHIKRRLGSSWRVERIIDWGAGAGSGLWASLHSFQSLSGHQNAMDHLRVGDSTIKSYVAIEKRNGLNEVGRRLMRDIQPKHISVSWQKMWRSEDSVAPLHGRDSIALSAFLLTTLPDALARKKLVQEIWDSGANTIVLIDHNSKEGFEAVAGAREFLLELGRRDVVGGNSSSLAGSHVVAPCPHDGACPLYFPGSVKLVCGFSQRVQRPEFVRRTKHSTLGHEDMGYSYIAIQRGQRPRSTLTGLGRIGAVGKWAIEKAASKTSMRELHVHDGRIPDVDPQAEHSKPTMIQHFNMKYAAEEVDEAIRLEAYQWSRLIFPPLKKSGHIILDGCTAQGKIMRMTIPRSQGKQAFYDARKSNWGDIFPHPPKNKPQERQHVPKLGSVNTAGSDIGKRGSDGRRERTTYESVIKSPRRERRKSTGADRIPHETLWDE